MTPHSSEHRKRRVEMKLHNIEASSFWSEADECLVTSVRCASCARLFQEELVYARARVVSEVNFLCLWCDPEAAITVPEKVYTSLWYLIAFD